MFKLFYNKVLNYPYLLIILFLALLSYSVYQSKNFELDASADTLLIENDPDLIFLRELNKKYKSEEFFIITYSPINLSVEDGIKELNKLVTDINNFKWVSKTISIINAPLLQSTNEPLVDRIKNLKFITNEEVDLDTAINELTNSPVYKNLIISEDTKTFGIVVYLKDNNTYLEVLQKKTEILSAKKIDHLALDELNIKLKKLQKEQSKNISLYNKSIKELIEKYKSNAEIRLSGIPMIADDMITFIKNDIFVFGLGVFLFIILTLWFVFKNLSWVIFPLINCAVSIFIMIGFLSTLGWKVTVISSNFIALMLILTMSMNIHYLVRYMQIEDKDEIINTNFRVKQTSETIFYPILYAVLTTICAFLSLVFSEVKPVKDFGWMMSIGLIISFVTTFLLLPALIKIFNPPLSNNMNLSESKIANFFFRYVKKEFYYIFFYNFINYFIYNWNFKFKS